MDQERGNTVVTPLEHQDDHSFGKMGANLDQLLDHYKTRKFDEDIEYLEKKLGGMEGIEKDLITDLQKGLQVDDIETREKYFGSNKDKPFEISSFCSIWWDVMGDLMLRILLIAGIVSIIADEIVDEEKRDIAWAEGFAILLAVAIVSNVTAYSDYKKQLQFKKLNEYSNKVKEVSVKRKGALVSISPDDLQVGDVVQIIAGMNIPTDGIIITGNGIKADESALTGESEEMNKDTVAGCIEKRQERMLEKRTNPTAHDIPSPCLISGTKIAVGEGFYLAVIIGERSSVGKIRASLETDIETTPLQDKLEGLARDVSKLGLLIAGLTVVVMFLRFFIEKPANNIPFNWSENIGPYIKEWIRFILTGITIIAVAVPEGLPLAVMISLAFSVRKMLQDMNFVKRLAACEIMGGANNICSDKTGTLTKNEMTVTNIWQGNSSIVLKITTTSLNFGDYMANPKVVNLFQEASCCNSNATIEKGSSTEKAILAMIARFGVSYVDQRAKHLPEGFVRFQFTSSRKMMSTVVENVEHSETDFNKRLHVKGAAEIVLDNCTHYLDSQVHPFDIIRKAQRRKMTPEVFKTIEGVILEYAKQSLRNICFAYKDLSENEGGENHNDMDEEGKFGMIEKSGLTCLCIVGIRDVVRQEVPDAVLQCQKAGIRVRMVTGDNKITATAIAKECHIIRNEQESIVMEGKDFFNLLGGLYCNVCKENCPCPCPPKKREEKVKHIEEFIKIEPRLDVIARSRPEDKYLLVTALRELHNVVAVTGDGTNDAPALKKADVGFAMGIQGTEISKEAADIVIMDDNFASIVKAVLWGRSIYDNIRKFLQFQLTVNLVALVTSFTGAVLLKQSALSPIQLLWVNLIMDSLGSLALATESPKETVMNRKPYKRTEHVLSRRMMKNILVQGIYQSAILFVIIFSAQKWVPEDPNYPVRNGNLIVSGWDVDIKGNNDYFPYESDYGASRQATMVFNIFVFMALFNQINCRRIAPEEWNMFDRIHKNYFFTCITAIEAILQILIIEFTSDFFNVNRKGLTGAQWGICLALGASVIPFEFVVKMIPDHWFCHLGKKEVNPIASETSILSFRKPSRSLSMHHQQQVNQNLASGNPGSMRLPSLRS